MTLNSSFESSSSSQRREHWWSSSSSMTFQLACISLILLSAEAFRPAPSFVSTSRLPSSDQPSSLSPTTAPSSLVILHQSIVPDNEQHHPEMAFEMGDSAGGSTVSSVPDRGAGKHNARTKAALKKSKAKQHKKNKNKKQKKGPHIGQPLEEEELINHVAAAYVVGHNGMMHKQKLKSNRIQRNVSDFTHNGDRSSHMQQLEYLKKLDRHPALVLNADYQPMSYLPLSMWTWQEAVKGVFSGKVTVVDVYPDVMIRAANLEIPLPSVIALNEYVPQFNQQPAFTKRNVFLRDEYTCQYCNQLFHTRDLSLDHVVPRCRGGHLNWENAVTSCRKCNGRKGSLPVNQLRSVGMKLSREPFIPTQFQLAASASRMLPRRVHPTWEPYLGLTNGKKSQKASGGSTKNEGELFFEDI